jgi:methionine synthase II (cobalamin-independent)
MEAQVKIIKTTDDRYEWHIFVQYPTERYMGIASTEQEAYMRLHKVVQALQLFIV